MWKLKSLVPLKKKIDFYAPEAPNEDETLKDRKSCDEMTKADAHEIQYRSDKESRVVGMTDLVIIRVLHMKHFPQLTALQRLHLSYLPIETLPDMFFDDLTKLRWVILRSFSNLGHLPSTKSMEVLEGWNRGEFVRLALSSGTQDFKKRFGRLQADLRYILDNMDRLECSGNCTSSEELLYELIHVADPHQENELPLDNSAYLVELLQLVARLKLLVPRKQVHGLEEKRKKKRQATIED
ncbi:hypothetical protein V2J09_000054 [Rumex salicifolius]